MMGAGPLKMCSVLLCLLLAAACERPPSAESLRARNPGLATLVSVEPVRITEGFDVWRNGRKRTVQDGLLIRLEGMKDAADFIPRAMAAPQFVLGDTSGSAPEGPSFGGKALLLMAAPPPETEVPLWLQYPDMPGEEKPMPSSPEWQRAELVARRKGWLDIRTPPANAPRATYATVDHLLLAKTNRRFSPELCADVEMECGVSMNTRFGVMDCGPCRTGQVCTAGNRCCTPTTCQARGQACGTLEDGCGNTLDCGPCASGPE